MKRPTSARPFALAMAAEGVAVRVVDIGGGHAVTRRVAELGLPVGSELTVRGRQSGGVVVARGDARYALGGGLAHRILVCEIDTTTDGGPR